MGQTCAALKRLYVHQSQYDALCDKLSEIAREQKVGPGLDEGVTFGPVQHADQLRLVEELVDDALRMANDNPNGLGGGCGARISSGPANWPSGSSAGPPGRRAISL